MSRTSSLAEPSNLDFVDRFDDLELREVPNLELVVSCEEFDFRGRPRPRESRGKSYPHIRKFNYIYIDMHICVSLRVLTHRREDVQLRSVYVKDY